MLNAGLALLAVLLASVVAGCGDDAEEGTTAEGGEATAGGEEGGGTAGGMEQPPGTVGPGDEGWDGDEPGGAQAGGGQPAQPGQPGGAQAGGRPGESPWGAPLAEQGPPLPPRRPMTSEAASYYRQGVEAAQAGNYDAARSAFRQALDADRNAYKAAYNLGVLADRAGQESQALEFYRRAISIQADYERAAEGIVTIYLRRGSAPDAIAFIEPIARRWVRNLHLQALYAEALVAAQRYDDAWEAARQALRRDERFVPAMIPLIKASLRQGRKELAESVLDQALAIDQNHAELQYLKARVLIDEPGRLRDAIEHLRRAVQLRPEYVEARLLLGVKLLEGANYTEALEQFQQAERLAPRLVAVHLNLGDAYRATKQWQLAKQEFDRALQMQPNLPQAHFNLALMYMTAGGEFPGLDTMQALQKAQQEFRTYRDLMGPRLPRNDPSETYLTEIDRAIEREQRRIEREQRTRQRDAERAARAAEQGGGTPQPAQPSQ